MLYCFSLLQLGSVTAMLLNLVINSHGYSTVFVVVKGTVNRNLNFSVFVIVIIGVARNLCLGK